MTSIFRVKFENMPLLGRGMGIVLPQNTDIMHQCLEDTQLKEEMADNGLKQEFDGHEGAFLGLGNGFEFHIERTTEIQFAAVLLHIMRFGIVVLVEVEIIIVILPSRVSVRMEEWKVVVHVLETVEPLHEKGKR